MSYVSCFGRWVLYHKRHLGSPFPSLKVKVKVAQSCPTLYDPMDYMVLGILQARILEWVDIPLFRGPSQPRDGTQDSHITGDSLPFEPPSTDGDQTMHIYYQRFYQRLSLKNSEIQ